MLQQGPIKGGFVLPAPPQASLQPRGSPSPGQPPPPRTRMQRGEPGPEGQPARSLGWDLPHSPASLAPGFGGSPIPSCPPTYLAVGCADGEANIGGNHHRQGGRQLDAEATAGTESMWEPRHWTPPACQPSLAQARAGTTLPRQSPHSRASSSLGLQTPSSPQLTPPKGCREVLGGHAHPTSTTQAMKPPKRAWQGAPGAGCSSRAA